MGNDLENKVIVLTGGASGIGRECALAYARENAIVAILDSNFNAAQDTAEELGGKSMALHADVSDGPAVQAAVATVIKELGRIDAVHNNAGVVGPSKPLHETTEEEFDKLQQVNLKSVYWTTKFAFPALVTTKGAMISLTKAMAADYARYQIRVNAVCPAGVWTPMLEQWCADQRDPSSIRQYLNDIHLLGYCPHGDVIADAAVFLLSAKARFITGCILPVSGGAELGYRR